MSNYRWSYINKLTHLYIGPPAFRKMRRSSSSTPLAPCVKRSVLGREIYHGCGEGICSQGFEAFHSHGNTRENGWFISEKIPNKNGIISHYFV